MDKANPFSSFCCNPLGKKGHKVGKNLRTVVDWMVHLGFNINDKMKICGSCRIALGKLKQQSEVSSVKNEQAEIAQALEQTIEVLEVPDDDYLDVESALQHFNKSLEFLGESPVNQRRVRSVSYCETKIEKINHQIVDKILVGMSENDKKSALNDNNNSDSEIISALKERFKNANNDDKLRILTILPQSWSCGKIENEFGVSNYMARKAKELVREKGVMCSPDPKPGSKTLAENVVELVQNFYNSDEVSRQLPGKKDYVSVKNGDNKRTHVQKRLVLANLKEIYNLFKETNKSVKVGFSKFAELRPKNCVLAGGSGTHVVCVCTYHQNVKLMIEGCRLKALLKNQNKPQLSYKDILAKIMCDPPTVKCHLNDCENCPGTENLADFMIDLFDEEMIDSVTYKQWVSVDRCSFETFTKTSEEFVESFCDQIEILKRHHFISKQQSSFFSEKIESLGENEALISLDFAENYSFIIQDEAQSYHWNNAMATIHPFVIYFKNEESKLKHLSFACISNCLNHDAALIHLFQKKVLNWLKEHPEVFPTIIKKFYYFSDGCGNQYKNRKNFSNLCHHKDDFGMEAEWHFHATAHGKGACDGIGGTVKRLAARASLQGITILNAKDLCDWAVDNIEGIISIFSSEEEYKKEEKLLLKRFNESKTIDGTRKFHCYIPISTDKIRVKYFSAAEDSKEFFIN